jgi:prolipoprotein diacylglyceryltransferase
MVGPTISRCVGPKVTSRAISTYTIAGFTGYAAANVIGVALATAWQLTLGERLIAFFAPPLAFIVVVTIASAIAGRERIVFYQTTCAGIAAVVIAGLLLDVRVTRLVDVATLGIGMFLVFGRIGCLSVACCHGSLGRGVVYGPRHVAVGFWARWSGRALWPVQAVEAAASAALVVTALVFARAPGDAAMIYIAGYAAVRFALEFVRGDTARPYARGLSEAQWVALATAIICSAWRPGIVTIALACAIAAAAAVAIGACSRRELLLPPHLHELDLAMTAARDGQRHETSLGVAVSRHDLPDGRTDWIVSSAHTRWNEALARRLAHAMWPTWELVVGKSPGVVHVIVG